MMSSLAKDTRATIVPCLRYRDAPAAIEWLCQTFGFENNWLCRTTMEASPMLS